MALVMEEGDACGPLCQHPSCWQVLQKQHVSTAQPLKTFLQQSPSSADSEHCDDDDNDDGLPTQAVVNLLDSYGPDDSKSPKKFTRMSSSYVRGSTSSSRDYTTRSSFPRVKAPHATPARTIQTNSAATPYSRETEISSRLPKLKRVEVQELFDLSDLQSQWKDTFMTQQYYVWVPNNKKKQRSEKEVTDTGPGYSDVQRKVTPKDVTEQMVPQELEWNRESTMGSWEFIPVLKRRPTRQSRSPPRYGLAYSYSPVSGKMASRDSYYGLYDLLDLPREVLTKVLDEIQDRDLWDRQKLNDVIMQVIPKLERDSSALSLAGAEVLQQSKMPIYDGRRSGKLRKPIPQRQLSLGDPEVDRQQRVTRLPHPPLPHPPLVPTPASAPPEEPKIPNLLKTKPLPAIQDAKVTAVTLGLPLLPPGVRTMKSFTYDLQADIDLTLGPALPEPRSPVQSTRYDSLLGQSDRASSLLVTMPTVASDTAGSPSRALLPSSRGQSGMNALDLTVASSRDASDVTPLTPAATPLTQSEASQGKGLARAPPASPCEGEGLGTIEERETDAADRASHQGEPPRSRRSVHFAAELSVPPQPPSSPETAGSQGALERRGSVPGAEVETQGFLPRRPAPEGGPGDRYSPRGPPRATRLPGVGIRRDPHTPESPHGHPGGGALVLAPPSRETHSDSRSDRSEIASTLPPSVSRENSFHSQKAQMVFREEAAESPAPPPPSPSPSPAHTHARAARDGDGADVCHSRPASDVIDDAAQRWDTESGFTISAPPPSSLGDVSRIHTPARTPATDRRPTPSPSLLLPDGPRMTPTGGATSVTSDPAEGAPPVDAPASPSAALEVRQPPGDGAPVALEDDADDVGGQSPRGPLPVLNDVTTAPDDLDRFDATEDTLKEELQQEYDKLGCEG